MIAAFRLVKIILDIVLFSILIDNHIIRSSPCKCSAKQVYFTGNTCARVTFLIKLQAGKFSKIHNKTPVLEPRFL